MPDADGRRPDGRRRRARGRGVPRCGRAEPRARLLRPRPPGESEEIVLGAIAEGTRPGRRSPARVQRRPSQPDPRAAAAESLPEDVAALPVESLAVSGIPDLMHHKFAVRDGTAVLTGSTNWTDDSWTRQENVMLSVESPALGEAYALAFERSGQAAGGRGGPRRAAPRRRRRHASYGRGSARDSATRSPTGWRRRSGGRSGACASARR